jgi:uncharacterized protein YceK
MKTRMLLLILITVTLSGCGTMDNYRCTDQGKVYFMPSEHRNNYKVGCDETNR